MTEIIEKYKTVVIQIATPYSTGTGFYLQEYDLIITNEHVVRGNKEVVIDGVEFERQLSKVLFLDEKMDLAFLAGPQCDPLEKVSLTSDSELDEGDTIVAIGHPFGLKFTTTQGIISNANHLHEDINYIQHDAALNPGNSGGPLINEEGDIIGVNTFIIKDGNSIGFSLPVKYLKKSIEDFDRSKNEVAARCEACTNVVYESSIDKKYCPHCGAKVVIPTSIEPYEPSGVTKTIEEMLEKSNYNVKLSRKGPNGWSLNKGSAKISISYHEKTGLIFGDAYLCQLPKDNIKPIYVYLLKQNYKMEGLTFSIKGQDIVLSLLIYDRYLNSDTGISLFNHLFERADFYDNILVEEYGAKWKVEE